jgi:hypothetical protein
MNNELSYWAGEPVGKSEFLPVIGPVQEKAFNQQIIREAFKDCGIWPVDGSKIVDNLAIQAWEQIPDIYAPDLCKLLPLRPLRYYLHLVLISHLQRRFRRLRGIRQSYSGIFNGYLNINELPLSTWLWQMIQSVKSRPPRKPPYGANILSDMLSHLVRMVY